MWPASFRRNSVTSMGPSPSLRPGDKVEAPPTRGLAPSHRSAWGDVRSIPEPPRSRPHSASGVGRDLHRWGHASREAGRKARTLFFDQHEMAAFIVGAKNGDSDHLLD